jgi:transcription elongation GreA/GreB family factor
MGSRVRFRESDGDGVTEVTLVHPLEASVAEGKISIESPVAQALTGARSGDVVTLEAPRGTRRLEVLEVG